MTKPQAALQNEAVILSRNPFFLACTASSTSMDPFSPYRGHRIGDSKGLKEDDISC